MYGQRYQRLDSLSESCDCDILRTIDAAGCEAVLCQIKARLRHSSTKLEGLTSRHSSVGCG